MKYVICFMICLILTGCGVSVERFEVEAVEPVVDTTLNTSTDITTAVFDKNHIELDDMEMANSRLQRVLNRGSENDVLFDIMSLVTFADSAEVLEYEVSGFVYTNKAEISYVDSNTNVSWLVLGNEQYFLDNTTKIAYSIDTEVSCKNVLDYIGVSFNNTNYRGTGHELVNDANLLCDYYGSTDEIYKVYYDEQDNVIDTGYTSNDIEKCNIIKTFTNVRNFENISLPSDYTVVKYSDYLSVCSGGTNKFGVLLQ